MMRRMRAMLEQLERDVRQEHRGAVSEEIARLDATATRGIGEQIQPESCSPH